MRTALALVLILSGALSAAPARAALAGPGVPAPAGCRPVALDRALSAGGPVCVHRVLVTQTVNRSEQNATDLTVTDHGATLEATFANWWPQGPPEAGMVVTLWGHADADHPGALVVDRWIDLAHGTGPAPGGGPYPLVAQVDVDAGRVPNNRTVWVPAVTFALDPQDGGDGDVHVQTFWPCPAAGLTTESTPPLRGYVDHPLVAGLTPSTDTTDEPHAHLADDPPVGVPVLVLGQIRVDYGFGWYELHPIRAWRPMTAAELAAASAGCASDPVPHLDRGPEVAGQAAPVPFGVPPCTDGSEFGSPPGFGVCSAPHCYVARTEIGAPETLAGPCDGVEPLVTPSQEGLPERLPGDGLGSVAPAVLARGEREGAGAEAEAERFREVRSPVLAAYGPACARAGVRGSGARAACAEGLAHVASGEAIGPARACRRVHSAQRRACARAALALGRRISAQRAAS